jgi:hypothetical protein
MRTSLRSSSCTARPCSAISSATSEVAERSRLRCGCCWGGWGCIGEGVARGRYIARGWWRRLRTQPAGAALARVL